MQKTNLKKPLSREFEQSLIKNLKPGNRIYPGVYNRRFNISIKEIVLIMNAFIDKDIINLRFQIQIDDDLKPEMYTLKTLPHFYYDDENDIDIELDERNYIPVYEVVRWQMKNLKFLKKY